MAFGGGTWLSQNKVLPGTYINFVSLARASAALSDRGIAAMPIPLSWGPEGAVFEVTNADFQKNSLSVLGYPYDAPEMLPFRELYRNARTAYLYRLTGTTAKATCTVTDTLIATARYGGARGNALRLAVAQNVDDETKFDVSLYLDSTLVEAYAGAVSTDDLPASQYVAYAAATALVATAGTPFSGGSDGTLVGAAHQHALDKLEAYSFNTLGCTSDDDVTKGLYMQYTKRMRDENGSKFQLVGHRIPAADYEGVISLQNDAAGYPDGVASVGVHALVYWTLGAEAACAVNSTVSNRRYDGELTVDTNYTQAQLASAVTLGQLIFHNASGDIRVLDDVNSLTTLTDTKGDIFQSNQTIRVCDQVANDIATLFNTRYMGVVPNDSGGRTALWADVVALIRELARIRAVDAFDPALAVVEQGETKQAVLCTVNGLSVIHAMQQLYMAVYIQ